MRILIASLPLIVCACSTTPDVRVEGLPTPCRPPAALMAAYEGPDALPHAAQPLSKALALWAKDRSHGAGEAERANALVKWVKERCAD